MRKTALLIIPLLLAAQFLLKADGREVEIRPVGDETIEAEPRGIVTAVFQVINNSEKKREIVPGTVLPGGWKLVTGDFPFELGPGEADIRLVSFLIPQKTAAGAYEVTYSVEDRQDPSVRDRRGASVTVLAVRRLSLKRLESPEYAIAGEEYESLFVVINDSNVENTVLIAVESGDGFPFTLDAGELILSPGDSKQVAVNVKTRENLPRKVRHHLRVTARVSEHEGVKAKAQSVVEIIPRVARGEYWHTIPTEISIRQVYRHREEDEMGFQGRISGEGTLDEEGRHNISFLLMPQGFPETTLLPEQGTYRLGYWTESYELYLGDRPYSLSRLTESSLYGRGVEGKLNVENFSLGSYYMQTRSPAAPVTEVAGYMDYSFNEENSLGVNYLKKHQDTEIDIVSLEGQIEPYDSTRIAAEYAVGSEERKDDAYLLRLWGDQTWISYLLTLRHAGPGYPGSSRDMDFFSARFSLPLSESISLNTGFRHEKHNIDLNPALASAAYTEGYDLGFAWKLETETSLSARWQTSRRRDLMFLPDYNSLQESVKFAIRQSSGQLSIDASVEAGKDSDWRNNHISLIERYTVSTGYRPTDNRAYKIYVIHDAGGPIGDAVSRTSVGLDCFFQLWERTYLHTRLQTNNYQESHYLGSEYAGLEFGHTFSNRSRISLRGDYSSYRDPDRENEFFLRFEYTTPLQLPVSRKKNIGTVSGYIYNEETNKGIPDAIVRLDGATAASNKNGRFRFPTVKPGSYYLHVDTSRAGRGLISTRRMPLEVSVEGAKETAVEVGVTRSASLLGRVMVYRFEKKDRSDLEGGTVAEDRFSGEKGDSLASDHGLANVLLELKSASEEKRVLTDRKGRFEFSDLRPGKWTLKIYEDELPRYHYLESDTHDFDLKPGQIEELHVRVLPQKRTMQIIEEGTILEEE